MAQPLHGPKRFNRNTIVLDPFQSSDEWIDSVPFKKDKKYPQISYARAFNLLFTESENEFEEKEKDKIEDFFRSAKSGNFSTFVDKDKLVKTFIHDLNENGESLLYLSAMHGHFQIVQWLVYHGANVNFQVKNDGNSALHIASIHGHVSVVRFLVMLKECKKKTSK